jgi:hypothetical protein
MQQDRQTALESSVRPTFHPYPNIGHLHVIPQIDPRQSAAHLRSVRQIHVPVHSHRPATVPRFGIFKEQ